jgi:hypothetical protein
MSDTRVSLITRCSPAQRDTIRDSVPDGMSQGDYLLACILRGLPANMVPPVPTKDVVEKECWTGMDDPQAWLDQALPYILDPKKGFRLGELMRKLQAETGIKAPAREIERCLHKRLRAKKKMGRWYTGSQS